VLLVRLGYARSVGLSQLPEDAPEAPTQRGYVAVPTYDVEKYGVVVGFGVGAAVTALFTRRP
jgi:hypothetical protein